MVENGKKVNTCHIDVLNYFVKNAVRVWVYKILYAPICEHLYTAMLVLNRMYIRQVPYNLADDKEIVFDNGLTIEIKYKDNYYHDLTCNKICYFNKKGRYIKIKGKTYYLNINQK